MNEIVPDPIDVRIDHQRVNEPEDEHHPEWRMRIKEEEAHEVCQMKKTGRGRESVPARVREQLRIGTRPFYSDRVGIHRRKSSNPKLFATEMTLGKF